MVVRKTHYDRHAGVYDVNLFAGWARDWADFESIFADETYKIISFRVFNCYCIFLCWDDFISLFCSPLAIQTQSGA